MGVSLSWLAVKGGTRELVLGALGLRGTGTCEEIPESDITGVELPTGWYLIVANRGYPPFMEENTLTRLSATAEVVTCFVEEHVMCSSADRWQNGHQMWSVLHDAQRGIGHLEQKGDFPPTFASICARLRSEQQAAGGEKADVDHIFHIPVELAEALTGWRHDRRISGLGVNAFELLVMTAAMPKRSCIIRLL